MDTNVGNIVGPENKRHLNKIYSLPRQRVVTQPPMSVVIRWCRETILSVYFVTLLFCSSFHSSFSPVHADPRKNPYDPTFTSNDELTAAAIALAERFTITVLREVYRMKNLPPDIPPHLNTNTLAFRAPPRSHVVADLHNEVSIFLESAPPNILVAFQRTVFQNCRRFGFYTDSDIARHGYNPNASLRVKPQ